MAAKRRTFERKAIKIARNQQEIKDRVCYEKTCTEKVFHPDDVIHPIYKYCRIHRTDKTAREMEARRRRRAHLPCQNDGCTALVATPNSTYCKDCRNIAAADARRRQLEENRKCIEMGMVLTRDGRGYDYPDHVLERMLED